MINTAVLVGRLTKDPELRRTQNGTAVVSFTLAVSRTFKRPDQPEADFISCVAWNKTAELMAQYLRKGAQIGVTGRIQTRSYDNQQGQKVYVTEVVADNVSFLEPKGTRNSYADNGGYDQQQPYQPNSWNGGYQNSYQQPGYSSQPQNQFAGFNQNPGYSAPVNPYAANQDHSSSSDYDDDDGYDIASDDLPF